MTEYIAQLQERACSLNIIIQKLRLEVREVDPDFIGSVKNCEDQDIQSHLECNIEILEDTIEEWYTYLDKISTKWEDLQCIIGVQPQKEGQKPLRYGLAYFLRYDFQQQVTATPAVQQIGLSMQRVEVKFDDYWTPQKALNKIHEVAHYRETKLPCDNRELYTYLVKLSSDIARDTRRGAGNTLIASPKLFARIKQLDQFEEAPDRTCTVQKMGTIGRFTVYTNHKYDDMQALIAYRGSKDMDCGAAIVTSGYRRAFAIDEHSKDYYQRIMFT